jgi:proteasome lid subunit RPN8/RPN11
MLQPFLDLPGAVCQPEQLSTLAAREVALAVANRDWFRLVECRRGSLVATASSPPGDSTSVAVGDNASNLEEGPVSTTPLIAICGSMGEAEAEARALRSPTPAAPIPPPANNGVEVEIVIFDVEAEIPQFPVHDVRPIERIAAVFLVGSPDVHNVPIATFALRDDFPLVPHLLRELAGFPKALCLWEAAPSEVALTWTAASYLERIREWLRLTARGELHAADQPLEPLFYPAPSYFLAPESVLGLSSTEESSAPQVNSLSAYGVMADKGVFTIVAQPRDSAAQPMISGVPCEVLVFRAEPQTHGVMASPPTTLRDLHSWATQVGRNLLGVLRENLLKWREQPQKQEARVIIVLNLPTRRDDDSPVEKTESYAFAVSGTVATIGVSLKLWEPNRLMLLINGSENVESELGSKIEVAPLNVSPLLSPSAARRFNGAPENDGNVKVVAIGAGALGSQVILNLARSGWGTWNIVDSDVFLPHNGARHDLDSRSLGMSKAREVCDRINNIFDGSSKAVAIHADVLAPGSAKEELEQALAEADIILDLSASVPVARHLALDVPGTARRQSLFLNPAGTQMVMLSEDRARSITLLDLEMQLWRAVLGGEGWETYMEGAGAGVRYGRTCGDVSARIPQDQVALHSALASAAVKRTWQSDEASILRWSLDSSTGAVVPTQRLATEVQEWSSAGWTVRAGTDVMSDIFRMREERLPNETGGVLLGTFDRSRRIAYLVAALPAPEDSEERSDSFLRGSHGLRERVAETEALTGSQVSYLGEWHSHPDGVGVTPSRKDAKLFEYLRRHRLADGLPPVMLIAGQGHNCSWIVEAMPQPTAPLPMVAVLILSRSRAR